MSKLFAAATLTTVATALLAGQATAGDIPNGNVNGDARTDAVDAALVLQYSAGLLSTTTGDSDVNVDGTTNSIDAALILQYSAGLLPSLPQLPMPKVHSRPENRPNGLQIYEVELGAGPQVMTLNDTITVHYTGWLTTGAMFDSSRLRGDPVQLPLTQVITGWRQGVQGMKVGGMRRLVIPPALAYGAQGSGDTIPPNATLIFDIELVSIP